MITTVQILHKTKINTYTFINNKIVSGQSLLNVTNIINLSWKHENEEYH